MFNRGYLYLGREEKLSMSHPTTARPAGPERQFVLGPEQVRATILTTGAETDGRHDLTDSVLPAGSMTPLHLHTRYEERIFVVSGSLTVWVGQDKVVLGAGDYLHIPTNVPHTVQAGSEDTHALNISSPAGFTELIARAGTPAHLATPETGFDADLFMTVTTELGDVVLGPPGTMPTDLDQPDGTAPPRATG
jgi:quercetin dioxygenase-like cupin family protein